MEEYSVVAKHISKIYRMYRNQNIRIKELLFQGKNRKEFFALKDVSFRVQRGKSVGLIGLNGSGKSTLANILGGITDPSLGYIQIQGTPALISIGAGLNAQLTGRENIEYKGLLIGLKGQEIRELYDEIISFADIGEFVDQPVKTYSSGMRARLGFAISVNIHPDILIVDEALSVGDPSFTQKCLDRMNEFRRQGKTVFFVSHSLGQVREFCEEAMWFEYGILRAHGKTEEVLPMYQKFLSDFQKMDRAQRENYKNQTIAAQMEMIRKNSCGGKRNE